MSDFSQGPGWWLASDGKWYPPAQPPGQEASAPPAPRPPFSDRNQLWNALSVVAIVIILVVGGLAGWAIYGSGQTPFGSGTPNGQGFLCQGAYLTWSNSDGHITGMVYLTSDFAERFSGTQSGSNVTLQLGSATLNGRFSNNTLLVTALGQPSGLSCPLATRAEWLRYANSPNALPTEAADRVAESDIVNAVTSAKAIYTNNGSYPSSASAMASSLSQQVPEMSFTAGPASSSHQVSVLTAPNGQSLIMTTRSLDDGRCWYVVDNENSTTGLTGPTGLPGPPAPQGISYDATEANDRQAVCSASALTSAPLVGGWTAAFPGSVADPGGGYKSILGG